MKLFKRKKAFFFIIDGVFAIIILGIGFFLVTSGKETARAELPLLQYSEGAMELLSSVRFSELCEGCVCYNEKLSEICVAEVIKNKNQTIMSIVGELYYNSLEEYAKEMLKNLTLGHGLLREDIFGFEFAVNGNIIYSGGFRSQNEARDIISSKRVIMGYYEDIEKGEVYFWGPYLAELRVWR